MDKSVTSPRKLQLIVWSLSLIFSFLLGLIVYQRFHKTIYQSKNPPQQIFYHDVLHRSLNSNKLTVIKAGRNRAVYVLDTHNQRHLIPDWSTFVSLGYDVSDIKSISDAEMNSYVEGDSLDPIAEEETPPNPFSQCPCFSNAQHIANLKNSTLIKHKYHVCFVNNTIFHQYENEFHALFHSLATSSKEDPDPSTTLNRRELSYRIISDHYRDARYAELLTMTKEIEGCDLLIDLIDDIHHYKYECPEKCVPIPFTKLPIQWFEERTMATLPLDLPVTCSMTWREVFAEDGELSSHLNTSPSSLLTAEEEDSKSGKELKERNKSSLEPLDEDKKRETVQDTSTNHKKIRFIETPSEASEQNRRRLKEIPPQKVKNPVRKRFLSSDNVTQQTSPHRHYLSLHIVLKLIIERRLEECHEKEDWKYDPLLSSGTHHQSHRHHRDSQINELRNSLNQKRQVFGLIVWVGSRSRYDVLTSQIRVLTYQNLSDSSSISTNRIIAGWMASEDQYGCRIGSTLCEQLTSNHAYFHYMPTTRLDVASAGWACAQRRPLRAISHTLLLYDPTFLLVADDDTFVNMKLLTQPNFVSYVATTLSEERLLLGQLTHGKKITRRGFYYGGAGYIIGRKSIEDLNSYEIRGPPEPMTVMIDPTQMKELSLFSQILPLSEQHCPDCVKVAKKDDGEAVGEYGLSAQTAVRVIDLCVNVMSQEHTCYHSDHAITRCYVHGIYTHPLDIECGPTEVSKELGLSIGMCMGTDYCDPNVLLTCHRWKPSQENILIPENMQVSHVSAEQKTPSNSDSNGDENR